VDDAVRDGGDGGRLDVLEGVNRRHRFVRVHERELEGGRAGVDDEDVQWGQVQSRMDGSSSPWARV
jgi:hypothetical protein